MEAEVQLAFNLARKRVVSQRAVRDTSSSIACYVKFVYFRPQSCCGQQAKTVLRGVWRARRRESKGHGVGLAWDARLCFKAREAYGVTGSGGCGKGD